MTLETATALSSHEERSARSGLIDAAVDLVSGQGGPGGFVRDLFGRVPPEDLAPYSADALAEFASRARDFLSLEIINDNRPFLLDSTLAALAAQGLSTDLVAHPILGVERDGNGALVRVVGETTADAHGTLARESLIHLHLDRLEGEARKILEASLVQVHHDVAHVVADHAAMSDRLSSLAADYGRTPSPLPEEETAEARAFLTWLGDGHFTLLGMQEHGIQGEAHPLVPGAHNHQGERQEPGPPGRASRLRRGEAILSGWQALRRNPPRRPLHRRRLCEPRPRGAGGSP